MYRVNALYTPSPESYLNLFDLTYYMISMAPCEFHNSVLTDGAQGRMTLICIIGEKENFCCMGKTRGGQGAYLFFF